MKNGFHVELPNILFSFHSFFCFPSDWIEFHYLTNLKFSAFAYIVLVSSLDENLFSFVNTSVDESPISMTAEQPDTNFMRFLYVVFFLLLLFFIINACDARDIHTQNPNTKHAK